MDVVEFLKKNGASDEGVDLFAKSIAAIKEKAEQEGLESKSVPDQTAQPVVADVTPVVEDIKKAVDEQGKQFAELVGILAQEIKGLKEQVAGLESRLHTGEVDVIEKQVQDLPPDSMASVLRGFLAVKEQRSEPLTPDLVKAVQPKQSAEQEDANLGKSLANPNFVFGNIAKNKVVK